jgi:hypothetical protein
VALVAGDQLQVRSLTYALWQSGEWKVIYHIGPKAVPSDYSQQILESLDAFREVEVALRRHQDIDSIFYFGSDNLLRFKESTEQFRNLVAAAEGAGCALKHAQFFAGDKTQGGRGTSRLFPGAVHTLQFVALLLRRAPKNSRSVYQVCCPPATQSQASWSSHGLSAPAATTATTQQRQQTAVDRTTAGRRSWRRHGREGAWAACAALHDHDASAARAPGSCCNWI